MSKKVVIAGGGVAGSYLAKLLEKDDVDLTLIDNKDHFEFRIGTPRVLVEPDVAEKVLIEHGEYLKKGTVVQGVIKNLKESEVILENDTAIPFDFLVLATGAKINSALNYPSRAEKIAWFKEHSEKLKSAKHLLVVGGGPVGVEVAAEVLTDLPETKVTIVHSGARLCEFLKPKASEKVLKWLQKKGAEVLLNEKVDATWDQIGTAGEFTTQSGKKIQTDYLYFAIGSKPDVDWLQETLGSAIEDGRVKVNPELQVEGHTNIFAVGDITNLKEAKQGYLAKIHAAVVAGNIRALLKDPPGKLKAYKGMPEIALVSLGRKDGVAQLPFGTFSGWFPANMKSKHMFIGQSRTDLGLK